MWRNTEQSYGLTAIILHWAIALLILGQILLGYLTQDLSDHPALQFDLYQWHKSVGFLILALALPRIVWSLASRPLEPLSDTPQWQTVASRTMHFVLLTLTLAVPLAGWAIASSSPLRIPSYVFDLVVVPALPLPVSDAAETFWSMVHATLAYGTGLLVLLHAAAALDHHIRKRDPTLRRMLPGGRRH